MATAVTRSPSATPAFESTHAKAMKTFSGIRDKKKFSSANYAVELEKTVIESYATRTFNRAKANPGIIELQEQISVNISKISPYAESTRELRQECERRFAGFQDPINQCLNQRKQLQQEIADYQKTRHALFANTANPDMNELKKLRAQSDRFNQQLEKLENLEKATVYDLVRLQQITVPAMQTAPVSAPVATPRLGGTE